MKKIAFYGVLIIGMWLIAELAALVGYYATAGGFSFAKEQQARIEISAARRATAEKTAAELQAKTRIGHSSRVEVIHPYLGWVTNHEYDKRCPDYGFCDEAMKNHPNAPITKKDDNNLVVALFGGSVAQQLTLHASPGLFINELKKVPAFANKNIIIHTIATGGYRQPQHLMALNYFLVLGAHFDVVINFDGFNEIVLPITDSIERGTHPVYPRMWAERVKGVSNPELLAIYGRREYLKNKQARWARKFSGNLSRYSVVANLIWRTNNDRYTKQIAGSDFKLMQYSAKFKHLNTYVATGPKYDADDDDKVYQDLARLWSQSSLQMAQLCAANNIQYYHFLQPNQYVANSKPMGPKEQKIAIIDYHPYYKHATKGYPYLIEQGKWLRDQGAPYYDPTMMFATTEETVYMDGCCHFNQHGVDMIIKRIGAEIVKRNNAMSSNSE